MAPAKVNSNTEKMARRRGNYRVSKKTQEKAVRRSAAKPKVEEKKTSSREPKSTPSNGQRHHGQRVGSPIASKPVSPRIVMSERQARQRLQQLLARHVDLMLAGQRTWDTEAWFTIARCMPTEEASQAIQSQTIQNTLSDPTSGDPTHGIQSDATQEVHSTYAQDVQSQIIQRLSSDPTRTVTVDPTLGIQTDATQDVYSSSIQDNAQNIPTLGITTDFERRRRIVEKLANQRTMNEKPRGIFNPKNTCFRNSVLQNILHIPRVLNWLQQVEAEHSMQNSNDNASTMPLARALHRLGMALWSNASESTTEPAKLVHKSTDAELNQLTYPWARRIDVQACAHEHLGAVMNELIQQSNEAAFLFGEHYDETILGLFYTRLQFTWTCRRCGTLHRSLGPDDPGVQVHFKQGEENNLVDMIEARLVATTENLRCDDCQKQPKCSEEVPCKDVRECPHPQFMVGPPGENRDWTGTIETAPEVLFIQLVRFEVDYTNGRTRKLHEKVNCPHYLDLSKHATSTARRQKGNLRYRLSSVVAHSGDLGGGHYIAYLKNAEGKVYEANDDKVYEVKEERMSSPRKGFVPYLLTYVLSPTLPTFPAEEAQADD